MGNKFEVELLLFDICGCNADSDSFAKGVSAMGASSPQAILPLIEFIVVIVEVA